MDTLKVVRGIALPGDDQHFADHIEAGPEYHGRGTYQFSKFTRILPYVDRHGVALDVGAHVGLWTLQLASVFDHVIAFEPLPPLVECWRLNTDHLANVTLRQVAVGRRDERGVSMSYVPGNTGNSHLHATGGHAVQVVRLDGIDWHWRTMKRRITFIKIDVEGHEYDALIGARQLIQHHRPVILIEQKAGNAERYGRGQHDARNMLVSWGMRERWIQAGDHLLDWGDDEMLGMRAMPG